LVFDRLSYSAFDESFLNFDFSVQGESPLGFSDASQLERLTENRGAFES
jgi:hypothetical protein